MKKLLLTLTLLLSNLLVMPVSAGVNDFYFSDFTGDYYLTKDEAGISHLRVIESMTAEFPNYEQNKGICRQIPFKNQGGKNVTLPSFTRSDIEVTRNGLPDTIYSFEREGDHYTVCTGTEQYLLGKQVYQFEYEFSRVVTDFDDFQELYWDTNGTGWPQKFSKVTARIHLDNPTEWTGETSCYVGRYGEKGMDRCIARKTSDGVEFEAQDLNPYENLTFVLEIEPGSYIVPAVEGSYGAVIAVVIYAVAGICVMIWGFIRNKDIRRKLRQYRGMFVAPQYQPHDEYSIAEMSEIYMGKKKDAKVGILLNLVVLKKVTLKRKTGALSKWTLVVNNMNLNEKEEILLRILNGGEIVSQGDEIDIRMRTGSMELQNLGKKFDKLVLHDLTSHDLVDDKYKIGKVTDITTVSKKIYRLISGAVVGFMVWVIFGGILMSIITDRAEVAGKQVLWADECSLAGAIISIILMIYYFFASSHSDSLKHMREKGMEMSKYMEGLKLYIGMAESERMKMLQSVDGVDTSAEGVVRLYEKLLPYAAVFGLEKSWMKEMEDYCRIQDVETPDFLLSGITASELSRAMRTSAGYASGSSGSIAGGGSLSSSSSGGGGGGFSGGGGGGGGGGGR